MYDVQPVWLLYRAERPRVCQTVVFLSIASIQMAEYSSVRASTYEVGVEHSLAGAWKDRDSRAVELGGDAYVLHPRTMQSATAACASTRSAPRVSYPAVHRRLPGPVRTQLPGSLLRSLGPVSYTHLTLPTKA